MGGVGVDKWFSNGQSDIQSFFTEAATELYLPGEPASGNITGKIASNVLTAVGTPNYQQALTGGGDDPLGTGYTHATADSHDAADNTIHEVTTGAFAWLVVYKLTNAKGSVKTIALKYHTASGYLWYSPNAGTLQARFNGTAHNQVGPAVGTADYVLVYRSATTPRTGVYSGTDGDTGSGTNPNISNAAIFALGSVFSRGCQGCVVGPSVFWTGAAAEAVIAARATDLPNWWAS